MRSAAWLIVILLVAVAAVGLSALFSRLNAEVPYRVVVSSGHPLLKRGESVTLTAYLDRTRPDAALPDAARLVIRLPSAGAEQQLPMIADASAAFHRNLPAVSQSFEYRVEAGAARSDWHTVIVVDPVTLANGTSITIDPPKYAVGLIPPRTREGFPAFEAVQFGRMTAQLKFTHPAVSAMLRWNPTVGNSETVPIRLSDDRLAGTVDISLMDNGTLILVLESERGVRTEVAAAVHVVADAPPRFEKVMGLTVGERDARPDDRIPIEFAACDDIRITSARIEYCLNGNEVSIRSEPISPRGIGTKHVDGAYTFSLAGKAKEGETLAVRLRVADNRALPSRKLGPQHADFPASGWALLHITASARPLAEQEILAQCDKAKNRLTTAMELTNRAATEVGIVQADSSSDNPLSLDQVIRLRTAREKCTEAMTLLDQLATHISLTPDLRPFAEQVRVVAEGSLRRAGDALRTAQMDPARPIRGKAIRSAATELDAAFARLTALSIRNTKTTRARLDRYALQQIAAAQTALAQRTDTPTNELRRAQRDLLARLNEAVTESKLLKDSLDAAAEEELRKLLAQAKKLAAEQSLLNRAIEQTDAATRKQRTRELAQRQRELTAQAAKLAERTATAARLAKAPPLGRESFNRAARQLDQGDASSALSEQEKAARELDRLADALAGAAAARGDAHAAAQQLAHWQDDLRRRYAEAARQSPEETPPTSVRKKFAAEQRAIRAAIERLRRLASDDAARTELEASAEALLTEPADAADALKHASDALAKLAERIPSREQRMQTARAKLDQLRTEQAAITRDADEALRTAATDAVGHKLDAAASRQEALARKIRQLDIPGQWARRERAAAAAERAAGDLRSGLLLDIPVSQRQLRQQLDRLRQALDGVQADDELADELARLQRGMADAATKANADELKRLHRSQSEIMRRLAALHDDDAMRAARRADEAFHRHESPDEVRKTTRAATVALTQLAARLNGAESDWSRIKRLVRKQNERAARAKQAARQPANPQAALADAQQTRQLLDELEQTRVGKAQTAKRTALAALEKLQQTADAHRRESLQRDAAEALQHLADEMARNDDRTSTHAFIGPPPPTAGDALRRLSGGGHLPSERDAMAARELARQQRALRDAASQAAVELAHGTRPAATDPLAALANAQEELANASHLDDAKTAVDYLCAGSVADALKAATAAGAKLRAGPARELSDRQAALNRRIGKLVDDRATAAARQRRRQSELVAAADRLSESLRNAIDRRLGTVPAEEDSPLLRAATIEKQAREKMRQAERSAALRRTDEAQAARRQAAKLLGQVRATVQCAVGVAPVAADDGSRVAGDAIRRAGEAMKKATAQLDRPNGGAMRVMQQAVDALKQAVRGLDQVIVGPEMR